MEINKIAKGSFGKNQTINPEGAITWADNLYRAAILLGSSFNLRPSRTFYYSEEDKFNEFITILEELYKKDPEFLEALVPYLRIEHGRKLSPMIIIGFLLSKKDRYSYLTRYLSSNIIDSPKRMAEVMATYKLVSGATSFKSIPYKSYFKKILESYSSYTLRKNKMRRRKIKLADLIKVLRPKPKDENMSSLYKAIIENDSFASLNDTEHVTSILSSTKLNKQEKQKILEANIETMPINALLRNLGQFSTSSLETKERILKRLKSVLSSIQQRDVRTLAIVNIFDLLALPFSDAWKDFGMLQDIVDEIVNEYLIYWRTELDNSDKRVAVLLDISWSMLGPRITNAIKFLSILPVLFRVTDISFFTSKYFYYKDDKIVHPINYYGEDFSSKLSFLYELYKQFIFDYRSPINFLSKVKDSIQYIPFNGTALVDAYNCFVKQHPDVDYYLIVSDEITWSDHSHPTWLLEYLPKKEKQKIILYNVDYMPKTGGVVICSPHLLRFCALNNALFTTIEIWDGDIHTLVKKIKVKYLDGDVT